MQRWIDITEPQFGEQKKYISIGGKKFLVS